LGWAKIVDYKQLLGWKIGWVPALRWMPMYSARRLALDLMAGLSLAAFVIPESLAYASLAQLPPVTGLYCYLVAGIVYALLGTSRQIAVGPTSALAIVIASGVAAMGGEDPARAVALASAVALMVGIICVAGRFVGLANAAYFISDPVLIGFKTGAALYIASTQLPKLFGVEGVTGNFFERVSHVVVSLPQTHVASLLFGLAAIVLFMAFERLLPGRPTTLIVVVAAIAVMTVFGLSEIGIKIVGNLPSGLPEISLPNIHASDISALIPVALACFVLAYGETISVARSFAQKYGYDINPEQELTALGAANIATGMAHGFAVAGGMSQTAVNDMGRCNFAGSLDRDFGRDCVDAVILCHVLSQLARTNSRRNRTDGCVAPGASARVAPLAHRIPRRVLDRHGGLPRSLVFWAARRTAPCRGGLAGHGDRLYVSSSGRRPWTRPVWILRQSRSKSWCKRNARCPCRAQHQHMALLQCGAYPPPNPQYDRYGPGPDQDCRARFFQRAGHRYHRGNDIAWTGPRPERPRHQGGDCRVAR